MLLEQVLSPLDATAGLKALRQGVAALRKEALADLEAGLASARFERLVADLAEQLAALAQRDDRASPKLKPYVRRRLKRRLRKVERLQSAVDDFLGRGSAGSQVAHASALHALRKELKKLRYASEFVRDAYPKRATRRYLRHLSALQDVLGTLQDNAVGERVLARQLREDREPQGAREPAGPRAGPARCVDHPSRQRPRGLRGKASKRAEPFWL